MRHLLLASLLMPAAALAGIESSSHKVTSRTNDSGKFEASAAVDGKLDTAWLVDPEVDNVGQWIELAVPKGKVDKVEIVPGWAKSDDVWADHARLKTARLEIVSMAGGERKVVHEQTLELEDSQDPQVFDLPEPEVGDEFDGGRVRITVTEVHPGKDFAHLALSELLVTMDEFDAITRNVDAASTEVEGHDGAMLVDDSTRSYWQAEASDEAPTFTVNAGRYSASSIGITPGPSSLKRPKKIEITQGSNSRTYEVDDSSKQQWFMLPPLFGYTGSNFGPIQVKVVETHEGDGGVAVADITFRATGLEAF